MRPPSRTRFLTGRTGSSIIGAVGYRGTTAPDLRGWKNGSQSDHVGWSFLCAGGVCASPHRVADSHPTQESRSQGETGQANGKANASGGRRGGERRSVGSGKPRDNCTRENAVWRRISRAGTGTE